MNFKEENSLIKTARKCFLMSNRKLIKSIDLLIEEIKNNESLYRFANEQRGKLRLREYCTLIIGRTALQVNSDIFLIKKKKNAAYKRK